jgi:hypothetical protein
MMMHATHAGTSRRSRNGKVAPPVRPIDVPPTAAAVEAAVTGMTRRSPQDSETRARMIAEAAYFAAERRGFAGGGELDDWLLAEAEIDRLLQP